MALHRRRIEDGFRLGHGDGAQVRRNESDRPGRSISVTDPELEQKDSQIFFLSDKYFPCTMVPINRQGVQARGARNAKGAPDGLRWRFT
jgi:hypothetical protein